MFVKRINDIKAGQELVLNKDFLGWDYVKSFKLNHWIYLPNKTLKVISVGVFFNSVLCKISSKMKDGTDEYEFEFEKNKFLYKKINMYLQFLK